MDIRLKPWQDRFIYTEAPFPAMVAGWGTGKSLCLILRVLTLCEKHPNNLALIVRKEYTDLKDSTIKDFELYTGLKVGSDKDVVLPNKSRIMFRHGSELNTLQNINLGVCGIEQAEEFDDDSQWFMLFGRMRRKNCGEPSLFLIANTNGNNWIKKLWKDAPAPGYELIEANTYDNADILPDSFIQRLETLKVQKPSVYNQYVLNSWEVTSGKIFGMWDENFHVIPDQDFPDWYERFGACDTAVQSGVFSAGKYVVTPEGIIIKYGEYYDKGKLISEHACGILEMVGQDTLAYWHLDPSAFNKTREKNGYMYSVADELDEYGLNGQPAQNDVNAGINRMGEYLKIDLSKPHPFKEGVMGCPRFMVTESCVNTRREIPMYREVPNKISDRGDRKWQPYKHDDHATDECRYAIMSRPDTPKEPEQDPARFSPEWFIKQHQMRKQRSFIGV